MIDVARVVEDKREEFEGLLQYVAQRFEIPGVLDADEVYSAALEILFKFVTGYEEHVINDPESFRKLFKTELYHRVENLCDHHKRECRDFRKLVDPRLRGTEEGGATLWDILPSEEPNPEELASEHESQERADQFFYALAERLDEDGRMLLLELVYPREITPEIMEQGRYVRRPLSETSTPLLAMYLEWPESKVKRTIQEVRAAAGGLLGEGSIILGKRRENGRSSNDSRVLDGSIL